MKHIAAIFAMLAVLAWASAVWASEFLNPFVNAGTTFFSFTWTTTAQFRQTDQSGKTVESSDTVSGSGDLAVTRTADGFIFAFDGPGGRGSGTTNAAGFIVNEGPTKIGAIDYPFPSGVTDARPGTFASQGQLTVTPDSVTLTYSDISHSNTFGPNLSAMFRGTGVVETAPILSAPEPLAVALVAGGLGVGVVMRRRQRSRRSAHALQPQVVREMAPGEVRRSDLA
jgi:hypothetical protein